MNDDTDTTGLLTQAPADTACTPIELLHQEAYEAFVADLSAADRDWLLRQKFGGKPRQLAWLERDSEAVVVVAVDGKDDLNTLGHLPTQLPEGHYQLTAPASTVQLTGWGLGAYQFTRYKDATRAPAQLLLPRDCEADKIINTVNAVQLTRDLINTPAGDMAPSHLAAEASALADRFGAEFDMVEGDALLDLECGAIHAVGRAADDAPRLIDIQWGDPEAPKISLVGKGVTFDSGGLNLKPAGGMRSMKKDMGGAATVLGLAYLIMAQRLNVRLRVLVPAAENAISGNAFRPGDILSTHKGLTVEIDNTDAEGRLLLCDALSIACGDAPELVVDYATLTGSARSAVGAEVAAMFCNDDALAVTLGEMGVHEDDAVWRMPLHGPYNHMLESKVADLVNSAASPYAGAITAALFLERFVDAPSWVHFDVMAYNTRNRPGHPEGGEAMGLRAVYAHLEQTYGTSS
ncbi:MAG: leucyl aminopeptidase family protein [Pseudomonadota bacterium]